MSKIELEKYYDELYQLILTAYLCLENINRFKIVDKLKKKFFNHTTRFSLKKVWEITRRMENWALNLQVKQDVVHKIRPGVWYSQKARNYPIFRSLEDFISAVEETVYQNPKTHERAGKWRGEFLKSYESFYGKKLLIPRWNEIAESYDAKKK